MHSLKDTFQLPLVLTSGMSNNSHRINIKINVLDFSGSRDIKDY